MLTLIEKGKPERRWCGEHQLLYEAKRCPKCAEEYRRWTEIGAMAVAEAEAYRARVRAKDRRKFA